PGVWFGSPALIGPFSNGGPAAAAPDMTAAAEKNAVRPASTPHTRAVWLRSLPPPPPPVPPPPPPPAPPGPTRQPRHPRGPPGARRRPGFPRGVAAHPEHRPRRHARRVPLRVPHPVTRPRRGGLRTALSAGRHQREAAVVGHRLSVPAGVAADQAAEAPWLGKKGGLGLELAAHREPGLPEVDETDVVPQAEPGGERGGDAVDSRIR